MKINLGRLLAALGLFFLSALWGSAPYSWSASLQKESVYLHEAVELRYVCRFRDSGNLYTIDFQPPKQTGAYRLKLLRESERVEDGTRINEFRYLLFPNIAGTLELEFPVLMRKTTQASIENTVIGRDNVEDLDFTDTAITTPKLTLEVKSHTARLVGSYSMDVSTSAESVKAYEPLHVTVTVTGDGNPDKLQPFELEIPDVEIFSEVPQTDFKLSDNGLKGKWIQRFALVPQKSFTLPAFELEYFDTAAGTLRRIDSEPKEVAVAPAEAVEQLLDGDDEAKRPWQWEWSYLYYLLTFVSGFVIGKWVRFTPSVQTVDKGFMAQVRAAKSTRELAVLLAIHDPVLFEMVISELEAGKVGLGQAKKMVAELTKY